MGIARDVKDLRRTLPWRVVVLALLATSGLSLRANGQSDSPNCTADHGDQFGFSVASVPDADGDGWDDLLVGAPQLRMEQPGYVLLLSGRDGAELHRFTGRKNYDCFGLAVAAAGDVNGDSHVDYIVGAFDWWGLLHGESTKGYVQVFSGLDRSLLLTIDGPAGPTAFGWRVGAIGDVDGDGHDDVFVAAPMGHMMPTDPSRACVQVYSGDDGGLLYSIQSPGLADEFGWSVCTLPDQNADGIPELVVGAPTASLDSRPRGFVAVFSGSDGTQLLSANAPKGARGLGRSVTAVGDQDGDGKPEVMIGLDCRADSDTPCYMVLHTKDGSLEAVAGVPSHTRAAHDAACAVGDRNADDLIDVCVPTTNANDIVARTISLHGFAGLGDDLQVVASLPDVFNDLSMTTLRSSQSATGPAAITVGAPGFQAVAGSAAERTVGLVSVVGLETGEVLWTQKGN